METLSLLARLSKDVRLTSRELSRDEARGLVDMYYKLQHQRMPSRARFARSIRARMSRKPRTFSAFFSRRLKRWKIKPGGAGRIRAKVCCWSLGAKHRRHWAGDLGGIALPH